ncbi:leucine-rich repeat and IQ domain-containing protein 1-like [Sardina pilchardus]|uniref:leucine-rich repeat and IQ domain-containing protein 1-like n=1 Tax=Sardina pilchardus TaxID=27697 RepID=UPI002E137719
MKRKEEERKREEERRIKAAEGSRALQEENEEESETREVQSTHRPGPHETENTHVNPAEQRTPLSSDDVRPDEPQARTTGTAPQTSNRHRRGTNGHLDQPSPTGNGQCVGPQSAHTVEAVLAGPVCLPEATEQKRLAWMLSCIPWSKLSVQNKRKCPPGPQAKRRGPRRPTQSSLPPLSVDMVLQSGAWSSLTQVTTVMLEDLPGCSLSTLAACGQLQSLSLRRCGLTSLEGLSSCTQLRQVDVQENSITYVDCRDLARLQVLRLGRNQLTSIHGLDGAGGLVELQLSHNRISRLGGLEALKNLQSLWIDHNQLTSSRGLTEAFTLQHLDLSHNHLTKAEGLDHCALLRTLRLAGNTLMEAPSLRNHVLLGELMLEDNSISCLEGLARCWLPLLHSLNVSQNSLTQLPLLSDFISLTTLDVSHNCLSELQSVCECVQGCSHLQQLNLTGNPLQQDTSWRSSLLAAVPGLLLVDGEETGVCASPRTSRPMEGSVQALCQTQQLQLLRLQSTQWAEISSASSPLEAQLLSGCHSEALFRLAEEQRYAHEYGDTSITHTQPAPTHPLEAHSPAPCSPTAAAGEAMPALKYAIRTPSPPEQRPTRAFGDHRSSRPSDPHGTGSADRPERPAATGGPDVGQRAQRPGHGLPDRSPGSRHAKLDLRSMAAVIIQKHWRGYQCRRRKCPPESPEAHGRCSPSVRSKLGMALPKPSDRDHAATVIQAVWRGHALRSRLHRALDAAAAAAAAAATAAATATGHAGPGDDEGLEEVDVDEFVFDEEAVDRDWTAPCSDGVSPPREQTELAVPVLAHSQRHLLLPKAPALSQDQETALIIRSERSRGGVGRTPPWDWPCSATMAPSPPLAQCVGEPPRSAKTSVKGAGVSALLQEPRESGPDWGLRDGGTGLPASPTHTPACLMGLKAQLTAVTAGVPHLLRPLMSSRRAEDRGTLSHCSSSGSSSSSSPRPLLPLPALDVTHGAAQCSAAQAVVLPVAETPLLCRRVNDGRRERENNRC